MNHPLCFNSWKHKTKSSTCINHGVSDEDNWEGSDLDQQENVTHRLICSFSYCYICLLGVFCFPKISVLPTSKIDHEEQNKVRKDILYTHRRVIFTVSEKTLLSHFPILGSSSRLAPSAQGSFLHIAGDQWRQRFGRVSLFHLRPFTITDSGTIKAKINMHRITLFWERGPLSPPPSFLSLQS